MTPYLSTSKTVNTLRYERKCEHCAHVVTSLRRDGLSRAYRKHLQAHHPDVYLATGHAKTTPMPTPARFTITCPYCDIELSASRDNLLSGKLSKHKREVHEVQFMDEIEKKSLKVANEIKAEPLVEVPVATCHFQALRPKRPAPKMVMVPARWGVTSVHVHGAADGRLVAYKGRVGSSEAWEVG